MFAGRYTIGADPTHQPFVSCVRVLGTHLSSRERTNKHTFSFSSSSCLAVPRSSKRAPRDALLLLLDHSERRDRRRQRVRGCPGLFGCGGDGRRETSFRCWGRGRGCRGGRCEETAARYHGCGGTSQQDSDGDKSSSKGLGRFRRDEGGSSTSSPGRTTTHSTAPWLSTAHLLRLAHRNHAQELPHSRCIRR